MRPDYPFILNEECLDFKEIEFVLKNVLFVFKDIIVVLIAELLQVASFKAFSTWFSKSSIFVVAKIFDPSP